MHKRIWWILGLLFVVMGVVLTAVVIRTHRQAVTQQPRISVADKSNRQKMTIKQKDAFIRKISGPAVKNFRQNRRVLPSVVIAQAILESQFGSSALYRLAKNPFGVKGSYHGQSMSFKTREVENGHSVKVMAAFRKYPNYQSAIMDHNRLLHDKFVRRSNLLSYRTTTRLLQENGYATDPHYAHKLNHLIVKYRLSRYDLEALNEN